MMQNLAQQTAAPDAADTRDIVYSPPTLDVPERVLPDPSFITILDQGETPASVGFALAAVLHYLRAERGERELLSPDYLYANAKRYDEWAGSEHEGSSLRGALKGLAHHGAALERDAARNPWELSSEATERALANRPTAYERIEPNIEHLKAAVNALHAVLVGARIHHGWQSPEGGEIPYLAGKSPQTELGAHAFAVIGYTERGFIVQNSWGVHWGGFSLNGQSLPGCALWSFPDAADFLGDAWVVRMSAASVVRVLAGYSSDNVGGPDLLEIRRDAQAFSFVLASKEVDPPLTIGLFGDWGGGKSFFMEVMQQEIDGSVKRALSAPETSPFHTQVVSIRFNAWHYLDADLWASLVTEVFDRLFEHIAPQKDLSEALKKELHEAKGLFDKAERQLKEATEVRDRADLALKAAVAERSSKERTLAQQLDNVKELLSQDPQILAALEKLAGATGIDGIAKSFDSLQKKAQELNTLGGRLGVLVQSTFGSPASHFRLIALAGVLLLPVVIAATIEWLAPQLKAVHAAAVELSTLLAGVTTWLGVQLRRGAGFLTTLEQAHNKLEALRKAHLAADTSKEAQELQAAREREGAARKALEAAELRVREIESELTEQAPGRRLFRFIEDRAKSAEYRSRLGIVSLVRRDFEHLSRLFERGKSDPAIKQVMPVERIILYIDDLDRCKPERVIEVLEAVHLLLAFPLFMVVVAVDPRWLRRCLEKYYPDLLVLRSEQPTLLGNVLPSRPATAQDYLEKIFQVPFTLQPLREEGFRKLVRGLTAPKVTGTTATGPAAPAPGGKPVPASPPAAAVSSSAPPVPGPAPPSADTATAPPSEAETIERLTLSAWELRDIQRLSSLFRTPRTVKRFINTYRFLRAGLAQPDRAIFLGSEADPGEYRAVIVLLAIVVSYPNISQPFLQRLLDFDEKSHGARTWHGFLESVAPDDGAKRRPHQSAGDAPARAARTVKGTLPVTWEAAEWRQLHDALDELSGADFPPQPIDVFMRWLPRVGRYSFSLSALLTLRR